MDIAYAVLFDMDGTLLQTEKLSTPAFQRTFQQLREQGMWNRPTPDKSELVNVLGMTVEQLWEKLLPNTNEETKQAADMYLLDNEIQLIKERITDLYPGVKETLQQLHEAGYALFIASNGQEAYIDAICEEYDLKPLMTDLYSAGRFRTSTKKDLVAKLLQDYEVEQAVMVGDRYSDIEAGLSNGLFTVGCDFGFAKQGELDGAHQIIRDFKELLTYLPPRKK